MERQYYLVKGWFENTKGLHNGKFYGACCDNSVIPQMVVLEGDDAVKVSELASENNHIVYPSELNESVTGTGAIAVHPGAATAPNDGDADHISGLKLNKKTPKKRKVKRDPLAVFGKSPKMPNVPTSAYLDHVGERVHANAR